MRKQNKSHEDSIQENLDVWCFEVGTNFENYSIEAAQKFIKYIGTEAVSDLGCGDGAATKVFVANGNPTTAVDINPDKLDKIEGAKKVETDFLTYLSKPVGNVFLHHSLEHYAYPEKVLSLLAKNVKKGAYCYIAVPKNDNPHSVHHVAFDSADELIPEGFEVIDISESDTPTWPEFAVITRKI